MQHVELKMLQGLVLKGGKNVTLTMAFVSVQYQGLYSKRRKKLFSINVFGLAHTRVKTRSVVAIMNRLHFLTISKDILPLGFDNF